MERVRQAVLLPVRIDIKDVYDETCTELRVTARWTAAAAAARASPTTSPPRSTRWVRARPHPRRPRPLRGRCP